MPAFERLFPHSALAQRLLHAALAGLDQVVPAGPGFVIDWLRRGAFVEPGHGLADALLERYDRAVAWNETLDPGAIEDHADDFVAQEPMPVNGAAERSNGSLSPRKGLRCNPAHSRSASGSGRWQRKAYRYRIRLPGSALRQNSTGSVDRNKWLRQPCRAAR